MGLWTSDQIAGLPGVFRRVGCLLAGLGLLSASLASPASAKPAFTAVPGSPFNSVGDPVSFVFGPSGRFIAASDNGNDDVGVYDVGPTGRLGPVHGSPFSTGSSSSNGGLAISPSGRRLAVAVGNGVRILGVSHSGVLHPGPLFTDDYEGQDQPVGLVAYNAAGTLLAAADDEQNTVSVFRAAPGGALTVDTKPLPTGQAPVAIGFDPNGKLLVTADENDGTLGMFRVSGTSVSPEAGSPMHFGYAPTALAFNPTGTLLAVTDFGGPDQDLVWLFRVHGSTVSRSPVSYHAQPGAEGVGFSPNGRLLAVANGNVFTMSVFTVHPGPPLPRLTQVPGSPFYGPSLSVAFSPNLGFLAGSAGGAIYMFSAVRPAIKIVRGSLTSNHHALKVDASCRGGAEVPLCRGNLTYAVGSKLIAASRCQLGNGGHSTLMAELSAANRKWLVKQLHRARHHRLRIKVTETLQGAPNVHTSFVI